MNRLYYVEFQYEHVGMSCFCDDAADLINTLNKYGREYLARVELVDEYLPEGQYSI